jgi:hypothetical protein
MPHLLKISFEGCGIPPLVRKGFHISRFKVGREEDGKVAGDVAMRPADEPAISPLTIGVRS